MSTNINSTEQIVEINAGDQITNINLVSQSTTQVVSGEQVVTVDVNAGTIPAAWGSITGTLSNQTDLQTALNLKQNQISLTTTGTSGAATFVGSVLNIPNYTDTGLTSVGVSMPTGFDVSGSPLTSNGTINVNFASGYGLPTTTKQGQWDSAYNDKITSAEVSGTTTKTLTLNQQDGGTITASWSDFDTAPVTSVFGRTGDVVATEGDYNIGQMGDVTITSASNGQVLKYNGTAWVNAADASGLTSVGLAMPSAFTVSGSPLTSNGTITVTGAGTTSQYVRGDGSLATFPSTSQEALRLISEVYNQTGATLTKGTIVYINGAHGNLPTVTKAIATGDSTSAQTFGFVQNDITNQNNGFIVIAGKLTGLNTQGIAEGSQLYLSSTIAGGYTTTKQYAPNHLVYVGVVNRAHPTQGEIEVKIQNGYEMDELHNVSARFPSNKDGIFYNSTTSVWENKSIAGVLGYTPVPETRIITINGTAQNLSADRTYNVGTVTNVAASGGTGISIAGSPVTGSGTITITNTAPDQVVSLTGAGTTSISGTYPNFTVTSNDQYVGTVTSVNATVPTGFEVSGVPITSSGTVDIKFASGYSLPTNAKQSEWDTAYTKRLDSLTVTGSSGSATLTSNVLNVPTYTLSGLGGEPAITAGTTSQYWRGDKSFQTLDTSVVPENGPVYFTEPRVRATVLSGMNITGGAITASDNILNAFGKVQNQINGLIGGSIFQSTWNASTNNPTLASGVGTKGYYYIVSTAGTTNLDGITDWQIGDWAIFDGTVWRKVDNTDAVVSVNGYTGIVSLVLDDLADVSAASPTDTQLLRFNGTTSKWYNWTPTFEPALTKGNLTEATSSVLTITGGSNAVIGSGTTIEVKSANATQNGVVTTNAQTFAGNKTFNGNVVVPQISINGANQTFRQLNYTTANSQRWSIYASNTNESGSNAGSNLVITRTNDDGTTSNVALSIERSTGNTIITENLTAKAFIKTGGTSSQYLMADGTISTLTNPVTGTGTNNYIAKFTATGSAIGNSTIVDDGTNIGINQASPTLGKLQITGDNNQLAIHTTGDYSSIYFYNGTNDVAGLYASATTTYLQGRGTGGLLLSGKASEDHLSILATGTIKLNKYTTNGFVKFSAGDGTLAVDTNTYLTGNQTITLSGDVTGSGATAITTTIANNAVTTSKINAGAVTAAKLATFGAGDGIVWSANTDGANITFKSTGDGEGESFLEIATSDNNNEPIKFLQGSNLRVQIDTDGKLKNGAGTEYITNSGTWAISTTGNAATATALATARNFTINGTAKSFDGTANVSWTASEIGLTGYLPLTGGTLTGTLTGTTGIFNTRLLVNQTSALSTQLNGFEMTGNGASDPNSQSSLLLYANHGNNPTWVSYLQFYKSRGTTQGSVTSVANNDRLGMIRWWGADGTSNVIGAEIYAEVDGVVGTNDMPTRITFATTADGASSPTERMIISNGGVVTFKNQYVSFNNNGYIRNDISGWLALQNGSNGFKLRNNDNNSDLLTINNTGASTFLSSITAASAIINGNISIGDTASRSRLYVYGTGGSSGDTVQFYNSSANNVQKNTVNIGDERIGDWGLILSKSSASVTEAGYHSPDGAHIVNVKNGKLTFGTNNNPRVTIDADGKFGIGTISPAVLTTIEGNATDGSVQLRIKNNNLTNGNKYVALFVGGTSTGVSGWNNSGVLESAAGTGSNLVIGNYENAPIIFQTNNRSEKMRIAGNGNVGINQTDPTLGKLQISGDNNQLYVHTTGTYASLYFFVNSTDRAAFYCTSTTTYIQGRGSNGLRLGGAVSAEHLIIASTGASTFSSSVTATSFFESSDIRLKSNIQDYKSNDILNISAKIYEKDGKVEVGYLAQDLQSVLKSAVSIRENGYLDLSYRQVHTAKIAALENEIKQLKNKLNELVG